MSWQDVDPDLRWCALIIVIGFFLKWCGLFEDVDPEPDWQPAPIEEYRVD